VTPAVRVYLREECHLCEALLDELRQLQGRWQFDIHTYDIDRDPALRARYNTRVPVVVIGEEEVCEYFLDPARLAVYFE
jgi:hypothetical protein